MVYLLVMISLTVLGIVASKASFLNIEEVSLEDTAGLTVADKFSRSFYGNEVITPFPVTDEKLPDDLVWEDGLDEPVFSSERAKQGGTFNTYLVSFPQTLRRIGPNSNGSFRLEFDHNDFSLVDINPITEKNIPQLATAWAIGPDKRTTYFKLDPDARWSDGVPVTADDYIFMLKLMRAPGIVDAWYNEYYSDQLEDILKFDDHTIAIRLPLPKADLILSCNLRPTPHHFYGDMRTIESEYAVDKALKILKRDHKEIPVELTALVEKQKQLQKTLKEEEKLLAELEAAKAAAEEMIEAVDLDALRKKIKALPNGSKLKVTVGDDFDVEGSIAEQTELVEKLQKEVKALKYTVSELDVCEGWTGKYNWVVPPFTGPYQLTKFMHGKWLEFERVKNWWANDKKFYKNRYNPTKRRYKVVADLDIAFEYFKQFELDTFSLNQSRFWYKKSVGLDSIDNGYMTRFQFWNDAARPSYLISMNTSSKSAPLLANKNIREGLAYSFNIAKMIDVAMLGDGRQPNTVFTGYGKYSNDKVQARRFDLEKAVQFFNKAGFDKLGNDGVRINDKGERLSFEMLFISDSDKPRLLVLKEEAARAGVELRLNTFDDTSVFKKMLAKEHELAWHGWGAHSRLTGPTYWGLYHGVNANKPQTNNFSNINEPELNELITKFRNSINKNERHELSCKMQEVIHNHCSSIPTFYVPFYRYAMWRWIQLPEEVEFPLSAGPFDYQTWWIDEEMKAETLEARRKGEVMPPVTYKFEKFKPATPVTLEKGE